MIIVIIFGWPHHIHSILKGKMFSRRKHCYNIEPIAFSIRYKNIEIDDLLKFWSQFKNMKY